MTQVMLDTSAAEKLRSVVGTAEIVDSSGQVLGVFRTNADGPIDRFQVPYTVEELKKFESEPGGRSLGEILRDLSAGS